MSKLKAGNIKKGMYILHNDQVHYVVKTQFVSPGKGSAFTKAKLRNMKNSSFAEFTFKSHDSVEELEVESLEMQFLYQDGQDLIFMNPRNYEQTTINRALLDGKELFLTADTKAYIIFHQQRAIGISLPPKAVLTVTKAEEAVSGDRQTAGKKPVELETGAIVQAPIFIKTGDRLIIDTESGDYLSRSND